MLNLAVDSGGTKVSAILFNEYFQPISACTVGSTRSYTTQPALIEQHINELISKLELRGKTISNIVGWYDPPLLKSLQRVCTVKKTQLYCEGNIGLFAAGIYDDGYLITAGTGSSLYGRSGEKEYWGGGYGSLIFDEGSGYWIAREGFKAAIMDFEQRGKKTLLRELIAEKIGQKTNDFHQAVLSIYSLENTNYLTYIASFAPLVSEAAHEGDSVALDILKRAGHSLGEQLVFLSNRYRLPQNLPIAISGNVWKGHDIILAKFTDTLRRAGVTGKICLSAFEPVVGAILCYHHNNFKNTEASDAEKFLNMYKDYRIV